MESPTKSSILDSIPTHLVKVCLPVVLPHLTSIVNKSLKAGVFPESLKKTVFFPPLKKPNLTAVPSNFHPISNLPFLSKTLGQLVTHQLVSHIHKFKFHDPMQSAYRRYHSTETSLLKIHNDILCAMDDNKLVLLIMLELSAAFDTVDHTIMIGRLSTKIGLSGTVLNWFRFTCHKGNHLSMQIVHHLTV